MKHTILSRRHLVGAGAGLLAVPALRSSRAQPPARQLRILVGFSAGGSTDAAARIVAGRLQERTGTTVVIDNKPGAGGTIAADAGAKASPDGSTIVLAAMTSTVMAKLTFARLPFDPQRDLVPISHLSTFHLALAVSPAIRLETVPDFVGWAKEHRGRISIGVPGLGGHSHFFCAMLGKTLGIDVQPVPYKGAAPMLTDLSGNQISVGISALSDFLGAHNGGKVRIVASTGAERSLSAPSLPTFTEAGFPMLTGIGWIAFYAPAKTPRHVVEALSANMAAVLTMPDIREKIVQLGMEPRHSTPDELAAFDAAELERWQPIVEETGFKVN
jgi:tripartite-type tricarboxylate transporter receptor subunit TctC